MPGIKFGDGYLCDLFKFRLVSSTANIRKLVGKPITKALLIGDVRYSASDSLMTKSSPVRNGENHAYLTLLDASEIYEINKLISSDNVSTIMLTRLDASESAFRKCVSSPIDLLHISTHGYYDPSYSSNPLHNSGLFLAGANRKWYHNENIPEEYDGILTAEEISNSLMGDCSLAVLSACETGRGDIDNNEGVFSLQRAFKLAGVQSLIMSLWKVEDEATSFFMTSFYSHWLKEKDMLDAFDKAMSDARMMYPDPEMWSAFVLLDGTNYTGK